VSDNKIDSVTAFIMHLGLVADKYYHADVKKLDIEGNNFAFEGVIRSNIDKEAVIRVHFETSLRLDLVSESKEVEAKGFMDYARNVPSTINDNKTAYYFAKKLADTCLILNKINIEAEDHYIFVTPATRHGEYHLRKKCDILKMMQEYRDNNDPEPSTSVINELGASAFMNPFIDGIERAISSNHGLLNHAVEPSAAVAH